MEEGVDYEMTEDGRLIFTRSFLLKRGTCCKCGCMNCPYKGGSQQTSSMP
ncbi:MAG: hypothetical protein IPQ10_09600 [Saprospiraceae bacterium]|nr:hypothetical protein [Saprospiraceae bacterium]MBK7794870.1 hypothetical protein [Saprospiraceae bacterium]MBL0261299.1 hypothetical protein [Saprospiraceae bacterium]MBX7164366.1 hypothetical protein [Saprospiraceae bacterium]